MSLHAARPMPTASAANADQSPFKRQRLDEGSNSNSQAGPSTLTPATANGNGVPKLTREERIRAYDPSVAQDDPARPRPPELVSSYDPTTFPAELPKSTSVINYRQGLFLAPMVRIGSMPTRLLSLEYGADLVWGPEIVDRAIMGAQREVDEKTGTIHYYKDGKDVFSTHPIERPYLIFQLGCATPAWAYEAVKLVTANDDVAGVDLNCGCPKNFSTTGGMGAGLLPRPDLLCDILRAMRRAAPAHVAVTCKIRLLPTEEETRNLIRMICRTGAVDAITIHCRTKEMRPREPALLPRIREVVETVREESGGLMPVCHNGDAWDWKEAQTIMKNGNVTSSMLARGPEKNPSCFRPEGQVSVADEIVPKWLKYAIGMDNHVGNTKYCLGVLDWMSSPGFKKSELNNIKNSISQSKTNEEMCQLPHYKDKIDMVNCKDEFETYVLGDLRKVLEHRQERRNEAEAKTTLQGAEGQVEESEKKAEAGEAA